MIYYFHKINLKKWINGTKQTIAPCILNCITPYPVSHQEIRSSTYHLELLDPMFTTRSVLGSHQASQKTLHNIDNIIQSVA